MGLEDKFCVINIGIKWAFCIWSYLDWYYSCSGLVWDEDTFFGKLGKLQSLISSRIVKVNSN